MCEIATDDQEYILNQSIANVKALSVAIGETLLRYESDPNEIEKEKIKEKLYLQFDEFNFQRFDFSLDWIKEIGNLTLQPKDQTGLVLLYGLMAVSQVG